jgi:hypothetical protein
MTPRDNPERPTFSFARVIGILGKFEPGLPVSQDEWHYVLAWREDTYAQQGVALVTPATARIGERVLAGENVGLSELQAALYDIWSGALCRYFQPPKWEKVEFEPA